MQKMDPSERRYIRNRVDEQPTRSREEVKWLALAPDGAPEWAGMCLPDIESCAPGGWVSNGAIRIMVTAAVRAMRIRTGLDVRMLSGSDFLHWMNYASWSAKKRQERAKPAHYDDHNFGAADYVILPCYYAVHWSAMILCHPGATHIVHVLYCECSQTNKNMTTCIAGRFKDQVLDPARPPILLHMDSLRLHHKRNFEGKVERLLAELFDVTVERVEERLTYYQVSCPNAGRVDCQDGMQGPLIQPD